MKRLTRSGFRGTLTGATKIFIAVAMFVWLVASGRLDFAALLSAPFNFIHILGILALAANMLLQAVRWWWLLKVQGIHLSLSRAVQLSWMGQFFSTVLPGGAGGDLVRAYYVVGGEATPKIAGISTVLMDRLLGLFSLFCLGVPALIALGGFHDEWPPAVMRMGTITFLMFLGCIIALTAIWLRPSRQLILRLAPARLAGSLTATLDTYQARGKELCVCFGLSLAANILLMGVFVSASQVLATPLAWWQVFLAGPLVILANSLPISPGGLGIGETTASVLLAQFGVETGAAIILLVRLWLVMLRLPGGLIYVLHSRSRSHRSALERASV